LKILDTTSQLTRERAAAMTAGVRLLATAIQKSDTSPLKYRRVK
jgi:hypothetical protein